MYMYKEELALNIQQWLIWNQTKPNQTKVGYNRGVMVKAKDGWIVISGLELHSRNYVHFRINTLRKGMNSFIRSTMG